MKIVPGCGYHWPLEREEHLRFVNRLESRALRRYSWAQHHRQNIDIDLVRSR